MNYVLSCSPIISPVVLDFVNSGMDVTVVTSSKDVKRYCESANIKFISFRAIMPSFQTTHGLINFVKAAARFFYDAIVLRSRLNKLVKEIDFKEDDSFHLLTLWIAYDNFYLAKEFAKQRTGKVYFSGIRSKDKSVDKIKFYRCFSRHIIYKCLIKLIFGLDLVSYDMETHSYHGIDDRFLKKNNIINHEKDFIKFMINIVKKSKISPICYDNIIIGEGGGVTQRIKYDSLKRIYKYISDLPIEIAIKKHPQLKKTYYDIDRLYDELFYNREEIPRHDPVELYFKNIKKNVIAISSIPLIVASYLEGIRAISLLELCEWYNEDRKKEVKKNMIAASKNRIIFIKDFKELKDVLISATT